MVVNISLSIALIMSTFIVCIFVTALISKVNEAWLAFMATILVSMLHALSQLTQSLMWIFFILIAIFMATIMIVKTGDTI